MGEAEPARAGRGPGRRRRRPAPGCRSGSRRAGGSRPYRRSAAAAGGPAPGTRWVAGRIHDQGPPVAQLDHIGAVAQAFVDDRVNGRWHGWLLRWIRGCAPITPGGGLPFGEPILQPPGRKALVAQQLHGLVREGTGAAAVGDDLLISGQLGQPPPQLTDRDRDCSGRWPAAYSAAGRTSSTTRSSPSSRRRASSSRVTGSRSSRPPR